MKKLIFLVAFCFSIQNDEAIPTISFIANAGGLVGLFLGMSFVSIFEIFYHLTNTILMRAFPSIKHSSWRHTVGFFDQFCEAPIIKKQIS
jgi:hypothetical protein